MTIPEDIPQPTSIDDDDEFSTEVEWYRDVYTLVSATIYKSGRVVWAASLKGNGCCQESCHGSFYDDWPDYFKIIIKKVMNDS